jgi:CHAD domain-containing protein/predicted phosphodiesterase
MRVAVLSDIHGNLLALEAVLDDLAAAGGADLVVIAGDLALGGPQPRETLERLRSLGYPMVQGNTDRDLALDADVTAAAEYAALLQWTREQLGPAGLSFLRDLPFSHHVVDPGGVASVQIVHANPQNLDDQLQPYSPDSRIAPLLEGLAAEVQALAFGHLHIPFEREVGTLLLANIASVGQPKDGDRRANYGLLRWERGNWSVEQRRVEYPVDEVVALLREANPPGADELIKTLLRARYPNMTVARGGRAPKRRAPAKRAVVHNPRESEALVMHIGAKSPSDRVPSTPAEHRDVPPPDDTMAVGAADREAGELDATPHAEVAVSAAGETVEAASPPDDASTAEELVTSDADFAEPPLLPSSEVVADASAGAEQGEDNMGDEQHLATPDEIVTEDADLAYTADAAASLAETNSEQGDDQPGSLADAGIEDDLDGAVAELVADAPAAETSDDRKNGKNRRKKVRKAVKRAVAIEASQMLPDSSFAEALPIILTSRLHTVLAQLDGVRADEDSEAVHDMRVATRRLRAALVAAEPFYGRKRYRTMARSVRDLARALGQVRDADVLLAYLRERYMAVATDERVGLEGLIDAIAADRATARDDLDPVLDAWAEDGKLAQAFLQSAAKVKARGGKAKARDQVALVAARALDRDVDQFMDHAELLDDEGGSAEAFHDLRIAGKKLRYTIELFAPVLDDSADDLLAGLKSLQELLGEIHDRDVLIDLLAWERARALERQLHSLEFATFNPGTRDERLQAARHILAAPDSFAATAIGAYGLLIDATIERDALEETLRERWHELQSAEFIARFHDLAESLTASPIEHEDDAAPDAVDASTEVE